VLGEVTLSTQVPRIVGERCRELWRPGLLGHVPTVG
jgi:hypothetical protein